LLHTVAPSLSFLLGEVFTLRLSAELTEDFTASGGNLRHQAPALLPLFFQQFQLGLDIGSLQKLDRIAAARASWSTSGPTETRPGRTRRAGPFSTTILISGPLSSPILVTRPLSDNVRATSSDQDKSDENQLVMNSSRDHF
jgi:hypothetical protein